MNKRSWLLASAAATLLALVGCASTPAPAALTETVAGTPQLSTLSKLINDAGLADALRGPGPFTVFAPTDEAFKQVPATTLAELAANKQMLAAVLTYHVVPGKVMSADVKNGKVKTVNGAEVTLARAGPFVTVEEAVVGPADIVATNGVVHLVDRVMIPPKR